VISALPAVTTLVCFVSHLHARLRVQRAPGIPHALCFSGRKIHAKLGRIASRECGVVSANDIVIPAKAGIQYSRGALESKGRGVLDRPVKPDDDSFFRHSPRKRAALVAPE
jgi:hypothetical protein